MRILIYLIIIVVAAAGAFLLFSQQRGGQEVEVTQDTRERVEEARPQLSEERDAYLDLLADNVVSGGVPKDGIPSIDDPGYVSAGEADEWLRPDDIVFGVDYKGFTAAYPQRILVHHEIVNEQISQENVSVTYCPLTGTAIGYKGKIAEGVSAEFGVSGKLTNSCLTMYDRATDSYWPQIPGQAITGPARGIDLEEFPVVWTTWKQWRDKHSDTQVLSRDTGFFRDYDVSGDPYGSYVREDREYYESDRLLFQPIHEDDRLPPKTVVAGIRNSEGNAVAIRRNILRERGEVRAPLGDKTVVVTYNEQLDFYRAEIEETGERINAFNVFWFAWAGFYPDTELIE